MKTVSGVLSDSPVVPLACSGVPDREMGGAVTGEKKGKEKEKRNMETVASLGPRENPIQHNCRSGIIQPWQGLASGSRKPADAGATWRMSRWMLYL